MTRPKPPARAATTPAVASSNTAARGGTTETSCGFQEHVRSWLAGQTETIKIDAIDARIEERRQIEQACRISAQW